MLYTVEVICIKFGHKTYIIRKKYRQTNAQTDRHTRRDTWNASDTERPV